MGDFRCGKGFLAFCGAGCPHLFSKPDRVAAHKVIGFCLLKDLVEHPSCLADVRIRAAIAPHPFQEVFDVDGAYDGQGAMVKSLFVHDRQPAHPQGRRLSRIPDQHLVQLRPYSVHRGRVIRSPAKQSGIEPVFSKTTKQQELGVAVHAPAKSGIWLILDATSKKAKRKAPYFKRSTVLFWWRIAGSNR